MKQWDQNPGFGREKQSMFLQVVKLWTVSHRDAYKNQRRNIKNKIKNRNILTKIGT